MLISQFSRATGLPLDTIRFYIRKGLLSPERSGKGGANPYQVFGPQDVTAARMIRLQQALGYSLREIAALGAQYRARAHSPEQTAAILRAQMAKLNERRIELESAIDFLGRKLAWVEAGQPDDAPNWQDYIC
ncbi:MerR family transcriptional regulator [Sphingomonas sp. G-3-2-10]|uniref:MerR family transcriptional regulator n=1 Tax=Sphingomonas sp. G-3-2-10 TaxID=2728838 RepID=UPI00146D98C7|nr:MerR family transcriptional regulator [Sphingomonas sp. G-3-2-10]NML05236.1 MerR family transcriptional regulator [Sphingomonas sp. G-3-2-10]